MGDPKIWGNLELSDFIAVRSIIIDILKNTFSQPTISSISTGEYLERKKEKAKKAGEKAEEFDPHSRVFRALDRLSLIKKVVIVVLTVFGTGAYYYLGISENSVIIAISAVLNPLPALGILGVMLYGGWCCYILALRYNRKVIQETTKKIRFSDYEIDAEKSLIEVRAYYHWNKILSNSASLLIIFLLTATRSFMPETFLQGTKASKDWVPEYVDETVSKQVVERDSEVETKSAEQDTK